MKKVINLTICFALVCLLTACASTGTGTDASVPSQSEAQLPNPMVGQQDAAAFEALGIKLDAPESAENIAYFIIDKTLAEVDFTLDGIDYTYRASKTDKDISGVYDAFTPGNTIYMVRDYENLSADVQIASEGGTLVTWSADSVNYSLFAKQKVDEASLKACVKAVMEKSFTGVEEAVTDYAGFLTFDESSTLTIDLDGDGQKETITVQLTKGQEYELDKHTITITSQSGQTASAEISIADFFTGYACDLNSDGKIELIVSGNDETDYSATWALRYVDGELIFAAPCYETEDGSIAPSAAGRVIDIVNGEAIIENTVDVLGTWGGITQYQITNDPFSLTRVPGSVWTRDPAELDAEFWSYCTMETIKELPVTFDGESSPSTLEAGVKIAITESDYESFVAFLTEDGRTGRIAVKSDVENWGWLIDGIHESEYFENIPYAG